MTKFTKEQLITRARESIADLNLIAISVTGHEAVTVALQIQVEEIALAVLTGKPFMHGIADPDGMAYFDEHCVAETPVTLADEVVFLNEGCESPGEVYDIVPLYRLPMLEGLE